jgi:hypothetical protein
VIFAKLLPAPVDHVGVMEGDHGRVDGYEGLDDESKQRCANAATVRTR